MVTTALGRMLGTAAANLAGTVATAVTTAVREMLDPYRPELHYMRGPGPKWHERHGSWRAPGGAA